MNRLCTVVPGLCLAVTVAAQSPVKPNSQISTAWPASIDGVLYADHCAGSDIGAKINACVALLPVTTKEFQSGYRAGTIILPNTVAEPAMARWSTPVVLGPGVNLAGQGLFASYFFCAVDGDCNTMPEGVESIHTPSCRIRFGVALLSPGLIFPIRSSSTWSTPRIWRCGT